MEAGKGDVHECEHFTPDREWERHDEQHEERHLCYEEQEDLGLLALWVEYVYQQGKAGLRGLV